MEEIKKILLIFYDWGYSKAYGASFPKYAVYINGEPLEWWAGRNGKDLKNLAYWDKKEKVMKMTIWGTDRKLEAKIQIGYWLGWAEQFQNNWKAFNELIDEKIKVIDDFVSGLHQLAKDKNEQIRRHAVGLLKALGFIV